YLFLKLGFPPQTIMFVMIVTSILAQVGRIYFTNRLLKMNVLNYIKQVIIPISAVTVLSVICPLLYYYSFSPSLLRIVGVCGVTVISSAFIIYFIGLTKSERKSLVSYVLRMIKRK
ncbi:MAG: hypothetical protein FWH59_02810, partial [Lentimicrobiaceae bacterium]|nr:hypothetical protein [Lentimicrobiaceae bacterium]